MENNGIFNFSYDVWAETIEMYKNIKHRSLEYCLQWFPFSKLDTEDCDARIKTVPVKWKN